MAKFQMVERTAVSAFVLAGQPVRRGQIVTLDPIQLDKLADAGCIEKDDSKNSLVPVSDLPDVTVETVNSSVDVQQARVAEARQTADAEIAAIDDLTKGRKAALAADLQSVEDEGRKAIEEAKAKSASDLEVISNEVVQARADADKQIAAINAEVTAAKAASADTSDAASKSNKAKDA